MSSMRDQELEDRYKEGCDAFGRKLEVGKTVIFCECGDGTTIGMRQLVGVIKRLTPKRVHIEVSAKDAPWWCGPTKSPVTIRSRYHLVVAL